MRFNVPSAPAVAGQTLPSQQIASPHGNPGPGMWVRVQNISGVVVWVADSQNNLDTSVDSTGTPQYGFMLQPQQTMYFDQHTSGLWSRSVAAGGAVECTANPIC